MMLVDCVDAGSALVGTGNPRGKGPDVVPEVGKKYGPYEILGHLGGGGMGSVYRGWDARLHREVAIKLLRGEYTMPGMRERFLREARAASALNHRNICTVFDIGEQDGEPYLVMELLEGQTLKDLIDSRTAQPDEIVGIAREIAEALGAAHAKGVIHRDIKPANIFLIDRPNGTVQAKVLDFGLAKFQGGVLGARTNRALELTAAGAAVGTLAYMSPEQARGEVLDSRTDLFSLGVVMYEMATRRIPFPGATSALVFVQLLNHQPESVRNWNESIPKDLDRIIFKLVAKERTQRFQTAQEVEDALAKVGEQRGGWLRKSVAGASLSRTAESVVRERKTGRRLGGSHAEANGQAPPSAGQAAAYDGDESHLLRPVARVPKSRPEADAAQVAPQAATGAEQAEGLDGAAKLTSSQPGRLLSQPDRALSQVALESRDDTPADYPEQQLDTHEFQLDTEEAYSARPEREASRIRRRTITPARILVALAVLLAIGGLVAFAIKRAHPALLTPNDMVVLTEIENRTGDKTLDGGVAEGLQIALAESPYLRLSSTSAYLVARRLTAPGGEVTASDRVSARNAAGKLGAKAYLFGSVSGSTAPYLIHIDLLDTNSDDLLTSAEERSPSPQQIPEAIDHIATVLRSNIGEPSDSIARFSNPLAREATTDLGALHAMSQGESALAGGKTLDALRFYQQAVKLQPRFIQAQLKLVVVYRRERAEVAAADAARLALAAADNASERTRSIAEYEYEMNAGGDYGRAAGIIRQFVAQNPHDADALERLARTLRLEGRVAEALQTAQLAYGEDRFNQDAYAEAESALIGLDRYEAAAQIDAQEEKMGVGRLSNALTAAYLGGRPGELVSSVAAIVNFKGGFRPDWNYGIYLDNVGQLNAGATLWRNRARAATEVRGLESTAALLLSQGAVDRALLGVCPAALEMAHEADAYPEGSTALFNVGMANGLCGNEVRAVQVMDQLRTKYPQSFAARGFYIADIKAAMALHSQEAKMALDDLQAAQQYDLISLTPLLRGRANVALHQVQIGIVDFQTVLSHPGVPFIVGSVSYPAAQIGVARAFAATGDRGNSAEAYRHFLELWKKADSSNPLVAEARLHSR